MKLPFFSKSHSFSVLFVVLLCLVVESYAAVLAIDYGTEWTKAALVKPGIPLQIVLTKDTKRKEQSVVAFKKQERLYGGDAFNLVFFYSWKVLRIGSAISGGNISFIEDVTGKNGGFRCSRTVSGTTSCC
jgi:hypothetical protein